MAKKTSKNTKSLTYAKAGVSLDMADRIADGVGPLLARTFRRGCIPLPGGFAGLFDLKRENMQESVLVMSTDGVGTKIKLAIDLKIYDGLGIDLVAMSVNDVLTLGATPLCFLDYMAFGKIDDHLFQTLLQSVVEGCEQSECALMGGETAEMPGIYRRGDFDLAGFCVGAVPANKMIDGTTIQVGDVVLGLPSSGIHSNGYSLVRAIVKRATAAQRKQHAPALLAPTRIYVKTVLPLLQKFQIKGMAHITGGGLAGNLGRIIPAGMRAEIKADSWQVPALFKWLAQVGKVATTEMFEVFNMGVGFVLVCKPAEADKIRRALHGEAYQLGTIQADQKQKVSDLRAAIV